MASIKMSNRTEAFQRLTKVEWSTIALIQSCNGFVFWSFVLPLYVNDGMSIWLMSVSFIVNFLLQLSISPLKNQNFAACRFPIMLAIVYFYGSYHQKPQHNPTDSNSKNSRLGALKTAFPFILHYRHPTTQHEVLCTVSIVHRCYWMNTMGFGGDLNAPKVLLQSARSLSNPVQSEEGNLLTGLHDKLSPLIPNEDNVHRADYDGNYQRIFLGMVFGWFYAWFALVCYSAAIKVLDAPPASAAVKGKPATSTKQAVPPVAKVEATYLTNVLYEELCRPCGWSCRNRTHALFTTSFVAHKFMVQCWSTFDMMIFPIPADRIFNFTNKGCWMYQLWYPFLADPWMMFWILQIIYNPKFFSISAWMSWKVWFCWVYDTNDDDVQTQAEGLGEVQAYAWVVQGSPIEQGMVEEPRVTTRSEDRGRVRTRSRSNRAASRSRRTR